MNVPNSEWFALSFLLMLGAAFIYPHEFDTDIDVANSAYVEGRIVEAKCESISYPVKYGSITRFGYMPTLNYLIGAKNHATRSPHYHVFDSMSECETYLRNAKSKPVEIRYDKHLPYRATTMEPRDKSNYYAASGLLGIAAIGCLALGIRKVVRYMRKRKRKTN
jgi:hypothetical protein